MNTQKFKDLVFEKMEETNLPGLSVSVFKDNEVVFSRGFGFRDIDKGLPATKHTIFGVGSITKSFTALSIMQLQEAGKLNVEEPVNNYLSLKIEPGGEPVLIKHLLTHTSGIPALAYSESALRSAIGAGDNWNPVSNIEDLLNFVNGAENWVYSQPEERWFYLNEGYGLLGAITEKCSGLPYEEYIRERIISPLGMNRSYFRKEEFEKEGP